MSAENKTILFKLELDTKSLIENSDKATKKIAELKAEQSKLLEGKNKDEQATIKNSLAYQKLDAELKQNTKVLKETASALVIQEQLQGKNNLTTNEQAKQQKALSVAYNNLTQSQLEAAHNFDNLTAEEQKNNLEAKKTVDAYAAVNKTLGENGLKVNDGRRSIGQYKEAIIQANKEITGLKKEITQIGYAQSQTNKALQKGENDLNAMAQAGDTTSSEYVQLQADIQELNETLEFQQMALNGATEELNQQEQALASTEKEARKIGFVYGENIDSLGELKQAIKDATNEQISAGNEFGKSSEQYIEATNKVGALKNQMAELKEESKLASEDTGFAKFRNTLGGIGDDLVNLDFEGVSEKTQTLQNISSKTNFKDMIGGLKNMGSSLLSLAKTILANPMFIMAAVIGAVVGALVYFSSQSETAKEDNEKLNDSFDRSNKLLEQRNKRMIDNAKFQVDLAKAQGKSIQEINDLEEKSLEKERKGNIDLAQALTKKIQEKYNLRIKAIAEGDEELEKSISKEILAEKSKLNSLRTDISKFSQQKLLLETNFQNDLKAVKQKEIEDEKARQEEIKVKQKEAYEKYKNQKDAELKLATEIANRTRDLQLGTLELSAENERKIIEAQAQFKRVSIENSVKDEIQKAENLLQIQKDLNSELNAVDLKEKENAKQRLDDALKVELSQSKGTKEQIAIQNAEIQKQYQINIDALDSDLKTKQAEREQSLISLIENVNNAKLESTSKTNEEILKDLEARILEQTNDLKQAGKTDIEIEAATQKAKIDLATETNKQIQSDNSKTIAEKKLAEEQFQAKMIELNASSNAQQIEQNAKAEEEKNALKQASVDAFTQLTNDGFAIAQNQIATDLEETKTSYNEKQTALASQLEQGLISQQQFESKKAVLDRQQRDAERELNKRAFETNKNAQRINAVIATAVAVAESLPNIPLSILSGVTGLAQIAVIESQPTPAFADSGKVLTGKKVTSSDGKSIYRANGDNILATVKTGEVVLNQRHQAMLGGDSTFSAIGVPGFASSGLVGNKISASIDSQLQLSNILTRAIENMPSPTVLVEDINRGQSNVAKVQDSGIVK